MNLETLLAPTILKANAGSGKTYALSSRYLTLLACGENPEKILATTFTRKAAGEILERVFQRLAKAASDKNACQELSKSLNLNINIQQAQQLLRTLTSNQHRLLICTLDSFFIQMASSFSLDLGLPLNWAVSDNQQNSQAYQQALTNFCSLSTLDDLQQLVLTLSAGEHKRSLYNLLRDKLVGLSEIYNLTTATAWHWITAPKLSTTRELLELNQRFENFEVPLTQKMQPNSNWLNAKLRLADLLRKESWHELLKDPLLLKVLNNEPSFSKIAFNPAQLELLLAILQTASQYFIKQLKEQTAALYSLLASYNKELVNIKQNQGLLSFDDIKNKLRNSQRFGELEELYYRLDSKIKHLLLDEFQDTSFTQWQILQPLAEEILSKANGENSFFCVGDSKQAIYAWRGGVAEIFENLEERYPILADGRRSLDLSYRSASEIIDAVNSIFKNLSKSELLQAYPKIVASWQDKYPIHETALKNLVGYVNFTQVETPEDQETQQVIINAAATQAISITKSNPNLSIAILHRNNQMLELQLDALSRLDPSINISGEGGNPLNDSPIIELLLCLFDFVDHPANTLLAYTISQSLLGDYFNFNDHQSVEQANSLISTVRRDILNLGIASTIKNYTEYLLPACSVRDLRRIQQLIDLAYSSEAARHLRISDFTDWIRHTRLEDSTASKIRCMTIHKSKGLEFDVVLLPFIDSKLSKVTGDLLLNYPNKLAAPNKVSLYVSKDLHWVLPELEIMHKQQTEQQVNESLSLLYVALTRPKTALYIIAAKGAKDPYQEIVLSALNVNDKESSLAFESGSTNFLTPQIQQSSNQPILQPPNKNKLILQNITGRRERVLPRISPSQIEKQDTVNAIFEAVKNKSIIERGQSFHRLIQRVEFVNRFEELADVLSNCSAIDQPYIAECLRLLKQAQIFSLFQAKHYPNAKIYRELKFASTVDSGIMVGTIDRLVIYQNHNNVKQVELTDFKSDNFDITTLDRLDDRVTHYRPQLTAYRTAAAEIAKIEQQQVIVKLAFLSIGKVVTIN